MTWKGIVPQESVEHSINDVHGIETGLISQKHVLQRTNLYPPNEECVKKQVN
jgi:hypothetical protein